MMRPCAGCGAPFDAVARTFELAPLRVGDRVYCKNRNWPADIGVIERVEGDPRMVAVRYGAMAHTLSTFLEDLELVA